MGLITRDEVKANLQISDSSQDTIITNYLKPAEQLFKKVRGIPYFMFEGDITNGSADITNITAYDDPLKYDYLFTTWPENTGFQEIKLDQVIEILVSGVSKIRGTVIDIDVDNQKITLDANANDTLTDQECIIYPLGAQFAASKIIQYMLDLDNMDGLETETTGTYSRSIDFNRGGLPANIANLIDQYTSGF